MTAPPNEDHDWTVCSDSDEVGTDLPEAELEEEVEEREWSVCAEDSEHDRCTEAMDYVNQLIARMNGDEDSASNVSPPAPPTRPKALVTPVVKREPPNQDRQDRTKERPAAVQQSSSLRQKSTERPAKNEQNAETADERQMRIAHRPLVMAADMQRLREAVNISMRGTLKSLDQRYVLRKAYAYLVICGGFIATSMILLLMSPRMSSLPYISSMISSGLAGLAAWRFAKVVRRLADIVRSDQRLV